MQCSNFGYHFSMGDMWKGYLLCQKWYNKGKGFKARDLCWVPPPLLRKASAVGIVKRL